MSRTDFEDTIFCQKVASSKLYIKSEVLPTASAAARYHCLWVFYQVRQWMRESIKAYEWGWTMSNAQMQPEYTDLGYAPDELLSQIHCKCKKTYLTLRCTCRKHGLICTPACGQCLDISSKNSERPDIENCP